jgi:hypothetical protein
MYVLLHKKEKGLIFLNGHFWLEIQYNRKYNYLSVNIILVTNSHNYFHMLIFLPPHIRDASVISLHKGDSIFQLVLLRRNGLKLL